MSSLGGGLTYYAEVQVGKENPASQVSYKYPYINKPINITYEAHKDKGSQQFAST